MKKNIFLFLFILIGIFLIPDFAFSADVGGNSEEISQLNQKIAEKRDKIKQLEASIDEYKQKISQKRLEAVSLSNQMAILDNRTKQIELDIAATKEKLESLNLEIEALELSIEDKEKTINKQKEMLSELLRTLNYNDNRTYIEVAAAYNNFSDFYNQVQYLKTVEGDLGKNMRGLRLAKTELEDKKRQNEERKASYEALHKELQNKRGNLQDQISLKQNLLVKTQSSELVFKTMLNNLKSQYQQIENEITGIEQEVRKRLSAQKKLENLEGDSQLSWPTQSRFITSYFHDPEYPYRYVFEHNGVDIRNSQGTPVKAAASGYIGRAKFCSTSSCYSYVMIIHSSGLATVYGHLSGITAKEDQFITRGDVIGYSGGMPGTIGAGPFVTGPHLHFEVRVNGIPVNPLNYLPS